ncbi:hypothetical protein HMPREF3192_00829 [Atopobium deltae]|uniref:Uncharacterized protein n=1 Tax=Atopobium deltae TaxID=1393034 RepID=A0A133XTY1_9ACTN|nr:hypothetical protein HMPREF3192_00829 [Atopobium deltae]
MLCFNDDLLAYFCVSWHCINMLVARCSAACGVAAAAKSTAAKSATAYSVAAATKRREKNC